MQNIIKLIEENTNYKCDQILKFDHIYCGYTNNSYCVQLKDHKKIFVKCAINKNVNKINEGLIYKLYSPEILIYSNDDGLLITKWIDAYNDLEKNEVFDLLIEEINEFHTLKLENNLETLDYYQYDNLLSKFSAENVIYHGLVKKWCIGEIVVSHNDINDKNYIVTVDNEIIKIKLIDFEWTTNNFMWWDYINYLAEQEIYEQTILMKWALHIPCINSIHDIYEMLFIRWWYCYGWSLHQKNILPNMEEYTNKCLSNIELLKKYLSY